MRLQELLPLLPRLRLWLEAGEDLSNEDWVTLHFHFYEQLPYGVATGDDSTFDEWLSNRVDLVEDLVGELEVLAEKGALCG